MQKIKLETFLLFNFNSDYNINYKVEIKNNNYLITNLNNNKSFLIEVINSEITKFININYSELEYKLLVRKLIRDYFEVLNDVTFDNYFF